MIDDSIDARHKDKVISQLDGQIAEVSHSDVVKISQPGFAAISAQTNVEVIRASIDRNCLEAQLTRDLGQGSILRLVWFPRTDVEWLVCCAYSEHVTVDGVAYLRW